MATTADPRLIAGRRFGVEIGTVCIAVALWLAWRARHPDVRATLLVAGTLLVATGLLRPALLAPVASGWLVVGRRLAAVTTPVVLTLIYLVVVTPIGAVRRTISRSPIRRDRSAATHWVARPATSPEERRSAMEHQF